MEDTSTDNVNQFSQESNEENDQSDDYETDSLFVCTEGKKLWIRDFHLILLRKRFKKLDKYSYAIDFCKEMM